MIQHDQGVRGWGGGGAGVTPSSPITNDKKREASTTNIPGIYPGRLRYQSILRDMLKNDVHYVIVCNPDPLGQAT